MQTKKRSARRGIEAVECAITLPLLAFVMFAGAQIAHHIHIQTMLKIAGAEAGLAWGRPGNTYKDAQRVFQEHCTALGLKNCRLAIHRGPGRSLGPRSQRPGIVLGAIPQAHAASNQLPLPMPVAWPLRGKWIRCEDIYYRRESDD